MNNLSGLDSPATTINREKIIKEKKFLKSVYENFYQIFKDLSENLPEGKKIEIGSGGGFLKEILPDLITSDVINLPNCDFQFPAEKIPFPANSASVFYLLNVFHHLKNPKKALQEMERCLKKGGKIIMIEPYNSVWGRFVYQNFHHEDFDPGADWEIKKGGPLSGANDALPWIIFCRDRKLFENSFPKLKIEKIEPHTPFLYLLSGGFSSLQLAPSFLYPALKLAENLLSPFKKFLGMFATILLVKK